MAIVVLYSVEESERSACLDTQTKIGHSFFSLLTKQTLRIYCYSVEEQTQHNLYHVNNYEKYSFMYRFLSYIFCVVVV